MHLGCGDRFGKQDDGTNVGPLLASGTYQLVDVRESARVAVHME